MSASEPNPPSQPRRWTPLAVSWLLLRLLVAAGVLWFTFQRLPIADLRLALARLNAPAFGLSVALLAANNFLGGLRWRLALLAFGATNLPPYLDQVRLYFVSTFFNTFVPGGVGGDVLRAGVTHRALNNATAAWLSVVTERILGLAALLTVAGLTLGWADPLEGIRSEWFLGAAVALMAGGVAAPIVLRPIARRYGLGEPAALPLLGTWLVSVFAHIQAACAGHVLARSLAPDATWLDSLLVVPLAQVAVAFPATVGGLGVREAVFVELYTRVGVPPADAGAVAFAFLGVVLISASIGGVIHVASPTATRPETLPED